MRAHDTTHPLPDPAAAAEADGLLVLGGGDVDPDIAGHGQQDAPHSYGVDRRADEHSLAAVRACLDAGVPLLAICRGHQLFKIAYGGTSVADITDYGPHRGGPGEAMFLDETVTIRPDTRLAGLVGAGEAVVRSGHHQAVDRVGAGLRVAAHACDGVVEALEDPDRWMVSVQWHPEDDDGDAEDRRRLFAGLLAAAEGRARRSRGDGESARVIPDHDEAGEDPS